MTAPKPSRTPRSIARGVARRLREAVRALAGSASSAAPAHEPGSAPVREPGWWDLLPFTTHAIPLAPGIATAAAGVNPFADVRVEIVIDALGGSVEGRTVVDLGCLEGGFTLAFAKHGAAHALGIEARQISVQRCELARDLLGLDNAEFVCADIKEELVGREPFDVVFAAGILYHVSDPAELLASMRGACRGVALIDTHVAREDEASHGCSPLTTVSLRGREVRGRMFGEYPADVTDADKEGLLWAAWSDSVAFWPVEEDLQAMIEDAGFKSFEKVEPVAAPGASAWSVDPLNRVLYVARV